MWRGVRGDEPVTIAQQFVFIYVVGVLVVAAFSASNFRVGNDPRWSARKFFLSPLWPLYVLALIAYICITAGEEVNKMWKAAK